MTRFRTRPRLPVLAGLLLSFFACPVIAQEADPAEKGGKPADERTGRMITIKGVIDSGLEHRVVNACRAAVRDGVEVLIFDIQASNSDFGPCRDLANEITKLGGSVRRTVAYVNPPGKSEKGDNAKGGMLTGHAVLVALACNEIVMGEGAKMGDVFRDRPDDVSDTEKTAYQEIAGKNGYDKWIALAMLDKNLEILEVTTPAGKRILPASRLDEFKQNAKVLSSKPIKEPGQRLLLDAAKGKQFGIVRRTVGSRREAALAYGLPERIAAEDDLFQEATRPVLLKLEGAINGRLYQYVLRRIKQAENKGHNLVFVQIDSKHGDEASASSIADALNKWPARKVVWIPAEATGPATMILFGCDELVMAPNARVGDFRIDKASAEDYDVFAQNSIEMAKGSKYPEALVRGFIDPNAEVFEVQSVDRPNLRTYKTAEEMKSADVKNAWRVVRTVKAKGSFLHMNGKEAHSVDAAVATAGSLEDLQSLYDVSGRLPVLQPGWVDALVDGLTSVGGTFFLIMIGMTCLYIEFQMPGFGVAGMISLLCFALFFWSRYLSDTANSLEIMMFLLGLIFLAVELFVLPGFAVTGLVGVTLIIGSLILASQSFTVPQTDAEARELMRNVVTLTASMVVFLVTSVTLARFLPSMPLFNRMVLAPPSGEAATDDFLGEDHDGLESPYQDILGKNGVAVSPLRPAGRMLLDDRYYDVVAQGSFLDPGTPVQVIEVYQNRIVVRDANLT